MAKYIDKKNTYVSKGVKIGKGTIIYPGVVIEGKTIIGENNIIYPGTVLIDCVLGNNNTVYSSYIVLSEIKDNAIIGPYANIRENNIINSNVKIGSFVEIKASTVDSNTKIPHLIYIGDSIIGKDVNIGCGVVTANYDGKKKSQTIIKDNAFIGCNVNLVAPLTIGKNSVVGAGSTIDFDVLDNSLAIARQRAYIKEEK